MKKLLSVFTIMALLLAFQLPTALAGLPPAKKAATTVVQPATPAPTVDVAPTKTDEAIDAINDATTKLEDAADDISGKVVTKEDFDIRLMAIAAILTFLIGYLGKWIPFFNKITDTSKRVTALAITVLLGYSGIFFHFEMTTMQLITLVLGYGFSFYVVSPGLEGAVNLKTPKPKPATA